MTVTGKSMAENLGEMDISAPDCKVIYPASKPRSKTGGLVILKGNLAPDGAVMKVAGTKHLAHEGPAKVYDGERACFEAVTRGEIVRVATWPSSGTKGRRVGRGCRRCLR